MAKLTVRGLNYHIRLWNEQSEETIVLLHGFTGSTKTWDRVVKQLPSKIRVVAIDLVGHGETESPPHVARYAMEQQIEDLDDIFVQLELNQFTLLGYSMGGRVALSYAVRFPARVKKLVLESASPGLLTAEERQLRQSADEALAEKILQNGLQAFVAMWENIPLFSSQKQLPEEVQQEVREERLLQSPIGLANSLKGMGTGVQSAVWNKLDHLQMPVLLVTGSMDEKFCLIAEEMVQQLPYGKHIVVNQAGHAIHVENPVQFATIVKEQFLLSEV